MKSIIITEQERNQILRMHNSKSVTQDVLITDWLSPDENYIIFLDELYDIQKKKRLGNIWENADNLFFFLKHSFEVAKNVPETIREEVLTQLSKNILTESHKDLTGLKQVLLEAEGSGFFQKTKDFFSGVGDFLSSPSKWGEWLKEKGIDAFTGTTQFVNNIAKGSKELLDKISNGEWKEVFSLLGKGVLYVARKLRAALYNPVGMILDAILIASGIGKVFQWLPWAVVVALDLYEIATQNFEEEQPFWMRSLFVGCDILSLVLAGGAGAIAKSLIKTVTGGAKETKVAAELISKNPALKKTIFSMIEGSSKVPDFLKRAAATLQKTFPMGAKFIDMTIGSVARVLDKIVTSLKSLTLSGVSKVGKTFGKQVAILGGLEGGIKNVGIKAQERLANAIDLSGTDLEAAGII